MTNTPSFVAISRHKGKRERTRAALIDAAVELIAVGGPEDIAISDVAAQAGVANGTFYNHFESKAELIAETAFRITEQIGGQIHSAGLAAGDPVDRIAAGARRFVQSAGAHPTWAWALVRSFSYLPAAGAQIRHYIATTIHLGVEAGQFDAIEDEFTIDIMISMLVAGVRAELSGTAGLDVGSRIAEMHLRMLGVPPKVASAAAYRELEPFELTFGEATATPATVRRRLSARGVLQKG